MGTKGREIVGENLERVIELLTKALPTNGSHIISIGLAPRLSLAP